MDLLVFMNSVFNPLFYYWRISDFRRSVRRLLGKCKRRMTFQEKSETTYAVTVPRSEEPTGVTAGNEVSGFDIA